MCLYGDDSPCCTAETNTLWSNYESVKNDEWKIIIKGAAGPPWGTHRRRPAGSEGHASELPVFPTPWITAHWINTASATLSSLWTFYNVQGFEVLMKKSKDHKRLSSRPPPSPRWWAALHRSGWRGPFTVLGRWGWPHCFLSVKLHLQKEKGINFAQMLPPFLHLESLPFLTSSW